MIWLVMTTNKGGGHFRRHENVKLSDGDDDKKISMIWLVMTTNKGGGYFKRHANVDLNVGDNDKKVGITWLVMITNKQTKENQNGDHLPVPEQL